MALSAGIFQHTRCRPFSRLLCRCEVKAAQDTWLPGPGDRGGVTAWWLAGMHGACGAQWAKGETWLLFPPHLQPLWEHRCPWDFLLLQMCVNSAWGPGITAGEGLLTGRDSWSPRKTRFLRTQASNMQFAASTPFLSDQREKLQSCDW